MFFWSQAVLAAVLDITTAAEVALADTILFRQKCRNTKLTAWS
jgi:hypothetical protein